MMVIHFTNWAIVSWKAPKYQLLAKTGVCRVYGTGNTNWRFVKGTGSVNTCETWGWTKQSLAVHIQSTVLGCSMQHCYVEHRRSMRLHPTPSHRGLWWAAILVKPMSVCTGGFTTAPFPYASSPCCSSSLLKHRDKSQFTVSECRSHVDECGLNGSRISTMQNM